MIINRKFIKEELIVRLKGNQFLDIDQPVLKSSKAFFFVVVVIV